MCSLNFRIKQFFIDSLYTRAFIYLYLGQNFLAYQSQTHSLFVRRFMSCLKLCSTLLINFIKFKGYSYKNSSASFLFSLRNKDGLAPFIANIKQGQEKYAIFCYSGCGPTFGGGNDLYICSNPQVNQSSSNFGHTYQLPTGYVYGNEQAKNLLAGQYRFLTTEIEVFN